MVIVKRKPTHLWLFFYYEFLKGYCMLGKPRNWGRKVFQTKSFSCCCLTLSHLKDSTSIRKLFLGDVVNLAVLSALWHPIRFNRNINNFLSSNQNSHLFWENRKLGRFLSGIPSEYLNGMHWIEIMLNIDENSPRCRNKGYSYDEA